MVIIGRPINGISLNGLEYLLNAKNKPVTFKNTKAAKDYLLKYGETKSNLDNYVFEEVTTCRKRKQK